MALDRQDIEKTDFPTGRRGYDPKAVDAHLRSVADQVESVKQNSKPPTDTLATAASDHVRLIVEAAEASAADITSQADQEARATRQEAADEAREHVAKVSEAAHAMIQRVEAMESELGALVESLRTGANRLTADLSLLGGNMGELRVAASAADGPAPDDEPAALTAAEAAGDPPIESEAVEREEEAEAEAYDDVTARAVDAGPDEGPATVAPAAEAAPSGGGGDVEGARLIALNMALNGTPREETDRYLAENFQLDDREGLLNEVYERVGG